jgi:hypothetical protein
MPIARARLEPLLMLHLLQMVMQVVQEARQSPLHARSRLN